MSLTFVSVFAALFLSFCSTAFSNDFNSVFEQFFFSNSYQEGYCGQNVMNFIKEGHKNSLPFGEVRILHLQSKKFVHLEGMRGYNARNQGPWKKTPGETMWYFHVILEHSGQIYDFDFMNKPTVLPAEDYFKAMFYPDGFPPDRYESKPGFPDQVRKGYQVEVIAASEYVKSLENPSFEPEVLSTSTLEAYLKKLNSGSRENRSINRPLSNSVVRWTMPLGSSIVRPPACSDLANPK